MSPGVEGVVEIEGDGEGASFASRGVGGITRRFGVSIKRGRSTPYVRVRINEVKQRIRSGQS